MLFRSFDLGQALEAPDELVPAAVEPLAAEPEVAPEAVSEDVAEDAMDADLLAGMDEVETRLELARAFIDMGDMDGARDILEEVAAEGNESQREAAAALLAGFASG